MRLLGAAGTAALLFCGLTQAGAQTIDAAHSGPAIGIGIICNTPAQAEQFVTLRTKGARPKQAIDAVNQAMHDASACGIAAIAFTRDHTVDTKTVGDKLVQIVRVNIIAGFNGRIWQRVSGVVTQYAVMEGEGETI
jgi:hypothetical protein